MLIQNLLVEQPATIAVMLFFAIVSGIYMERWRANHARAEWRARNGGKQRFYQTKNNVVPLNSAADKSPTTASATDQLRTVMAAEFQRQAILNHSESRLFSKIERTIDELDLDWRLMAQVSLGEILRSPDKAAYWAINSKRVDMLIVDNKGMPLHAIEYQGGGHHQGTAAARDAVKKEALRKAGVGYIEIAKGDTPAELRLKLTRLSIPPKEPLRLGPICIEGCAR